MPSLTGPVVPAGRIRSLRQPRLQATDLVIRPWHLGDAAAVLAAYQDPAIQYWHVRSMDDLAARGHHVAARAVTAVSAHDMHLHARLRNQRGAFWARTGS